MAPRSGLRSALVLLCAFTALCASWLGIMDILLHHPASQMVIAAAILCQALGTLGALRLPVLRYPAMLGCVGLLWLATKALLGIVNGSHMEGYILLIALALIAQSGLTLYVFLLRSTRLPIR